MVSDEVRLRKAVAAHRAAEEAERAADAARAKRDRLVAEAVGAGITPYRIAKELGVALTTPARMVKADEKRRAAG